MGRHHGEAAVSGQGNHDVEKGHGIGAAGEADHHALPGGRMPEAPEGLGDAGLEIGTPHGEGFLLRVGKWWRCRDLNPGRRGYEPRALTN